VKIQFSHGHENMWGHTFSPIRNGLIMAKIKKSKFWEPFLIYQLINAVSPAQIKCIRAELAEILVGKSKTVVFDLIFFSWLSLWILPRSTEPATGRSLLPVFATQYFRLIWAASLSGECR
jgi:hypothetical protein